MKRLIQVWTLGLLFGALAQAQSHRVVPDQLTVPLNGMGTFQIVISTSGVDPACHTTGTIVASPTGVVNVTPGTIDFLGGSGSFAVFGNHIGVTTLTLDWFFACPVAPGDPSFTIHITKQLPINVPSGGGGGISPTSASNTNGGSVRDPISTATGELNGFDRSPDLSLGGPLRLEFRRYYASFLAANNVNGALGTNWMHNFEVKLNVQGDTATVTLFRGKPIAFSRAGAVWQLAGKQRYNYQLVSVGPEIQFLDPLEDRIYSFNASGALIRINDRNGNALTVTQAAGGLGPERVSDGLGRVLNFTYAGQRLMQVEDQTARRVAFEYTGDLLTAVVDTNGKRWSYAYTTSGTLTGLITAETRPAGNKPYTQEFDSQGRVSRQLDSFGNATVVDYQAGPSTSKVTEPRGVFYSHVHDAQGNLTRLDDAASKSILYAYDANDRLNMLTNRLGDRVSIAYHTPSGFRASATDEEGHTTTYTYSVQSQGPFTFYNLIGVGNPDGTSIGMTYDAAGNVLTRTDPAGKIWRYTYNSRGQYETVTNPDGGVANFTYRGDGTLATGQSASGDMTTFTYDGAFRLEQATHPDAATESNQYDARDNLLRHTDERGSVVVYTYNDNNYRRAITDASGATWATAFDTDDRVSTITDPLSKVTQHLYDANGKLQSVTNPAGNKVQYQYDALNRITKLQDAAGKGSAFNYDAEGRLTSAADGLSRTWSFTRDKVGRVTKLTTPRGENYVRTYDSMGRTSATTDPLSRMARYTYESRGLPATVEMPAGLSAAFTYNNLGRLTRIADASGNAWKQGYDVAGRPTSRTDPLGQITGYTYDSRQRISRIDFPDGNVQITYDPAGNLTRAISTDGADVQFTYDANNRLTSAAGLALGYDSAGRINASNGLTIERDDAGRIAVITYAAGKSVHYTYDVRGLPTRVNDWVGGATELTWDDAEQLIAINYANGIRQEFTYDSNGRLILNKVLRAGNGTQLASVVLTRDAAGQITSADRTPAPVDQPAGVVAFTYGTGHLVQSHTYDMQGRVTAESARTCTWDTRSRLQSYSGTDGTAAFAYDALGQRISRTAGGATDNYVLDYAFRLPQIAVVRSGNADRRYYLHLPDGRLLAAIDADNARRFYHFDETGSTLLLTDDAGAATDTYSISPFGETVIHTGATENPYTFQGALGIAQEGTTGLYYMRARYYDSATARFLSPDPVETLDPRAINPYQYALDNPLSFGDPSGRNAANLLKTALPNGIPADSAWGDAILDWWNQFLGLPASPNVPDYGDTSGLECSFALSQQHACPPADQRQAVADWWQKWVDESTSKPPKP